MRSWPARPRVQQAATLQQARGRPARQPKERGQRDGSDETHSPLDRALRVARGGAADGCSHRCGRVHSSPWIERNERRIRPQSTNDPRVARERRRKGLRVDPQEHRCRRVRARRAERGSPPGERGDFTREGGGLPGSIRGGLRDPGRFAAHADLAVHRRFWIDASHVRAVLPRRPGLRGRPEGALRRREPADGSERRVHPRHLDRNDGEAVRDTGDRSRDRRGRGAPADRRVRRSVATEGG